MSKSRKSKFEEEERLMREISRNLETWQVEEEIDPRYEAAVADSESMFMELVGLGDGSYFLD